MTDTTAGNIKVKIMDSVEIPILTRCCFCIPLRRGLITMAYLNLVITSILLPTFSYYIFNEEGRSALQPTDDSVQNGVTKTIWPQIYVEFVAIIIEILMTIVFIVALHMKYVPLMRAYLYYGIGYFFFSLVFNIVLTIIQDLSANELIMFVAQLIVHCYFLVLIWSSIVKISRDGSVKYIRSNDV